MASAPGLARTPPGPRVEARLQALGFVVQRAVLPDEQAIAHRGPARDREGPRPRRHDGRHRADAARRHAAGDQGRDRLRGPRVGRGDARRGPCQHPARRPVARRGRRHRPGAGREPARQPAAARWSRWRPSRPSSTTRSRRSPGRTTTTSRLEARASDPLRPLRRGPVLPARLPALLGRGRLLLPRDGPPPAGVRGGPGRGSESRSRTSRAGSSG